MLLGYLSQSRDIAGRIRTGLPGSNFGALVGCIEEFISHHKKVDALFEHDTSDAHDARGHNPHNSVTGRLSRMLAGLKDIEESFV